MRDCHTTDGLLGQHRYRELGAEYFDQLDRARTSARLVRRLERLGFTVSLAEPAPAAAQATAGP